LHTNHALEAIPRLIDMGAEPYLLASTLLLMQKHRRLVRRLCPDCKQPYKPSQEELDMFAKRILYKSTSRFK
jgi:type II secretory ATPase GspE/PulE/Tfp pilus assembly ATPase PilB-like protein